MKRISLLPEKTLRLLVNSLILTILFFIPRKKSQNELLIAKIDALGDFVIFLPSLIRYRSLFPGYRLTLLVSSSINKQIAERLRDVYIDEVMYMHDNRFATSFLYRLSLSVKLYRRHFKIAVYPVYFRRFIGDFLMKAAKAAQTITFAGYRIQEENDFTMSAHYSSLLYLPTDITNEFYKHAFFLKELFYDRGESYNPYFPLTEQDRNDAHSLLKEHGIPSTYVVIFPGSGSPIRNWPVEKFKIIIDYLHSLSMHVVICGSKSESHIAEKIISLVKDPAHVTNLSGSTSIFQLAALIEKSKLYIGGDTGPTHVSAAVGAPTICLMGGGVFREFFPYGNEEKNRIVYDKTMACTNDDWACTANLPYNAPAPCIEAITVEDVMSEIKHLLKKYP